MTLVQEVSDLATRVGTEFKAVRTEFQPKDTDLTAIAGLDSATVGGIWSDGAGWVKKTAAQFKTALGLAKADVGLANVDNTSDVNKPVSTAQQAALDGKQPLDSDLTAIAAIAPANDDVIQRKAGAWINRTMAQLKTDLGLVKGDVGLGNVDNTSDANKPVSTAQQTALDGKQPLDADLTAIAALVSAADKLPYATGAGTWSLTTVSAFIRTLLDDANAATALATLGAEAAANKGQANGYASLDGGGKVPSAQLPAYVDDVLEYANLAAFPGSGATGIIYVAADTNHFYRWSGSAYIDLTGTAGPSSTDGLAEGVTNLYYTQARTDARINALLDAQMGDETTDFVAVFNAALV